MKKLFLLMCLTPFFIFAQQDTTANKITVTEEINDCVNNVYNNPDAIKLLMMRLMSDKEKMKEIHKQVMADPEMRKMMQDMRKEMHMEHDMEDRNMMNHQNMEMKKDTTSNKMK